MKAGRYIWLVALISAAFVLAVEGQENPVAGNPAAIQEGTSLFRANCSPCHGLNAQGGGRGPDLTAGRWVHGSSDADIFRTITRGCPEPRCPQMDSTIPRPGQSWPTFARWLPRREQRSPEIQPKARRFSGERRGARPATWCGGTVECLVRICRAWAKRAPYLT